MVKVSVIRKLIVTNVIKNLSVLSQFIAINVEWYTEQKLCLTSKESEIEVSSDESWQFPDKLNRLGFIR